VYKFKISGFEFIPLYLESSKLIGIFDLMLRWKCDSALKIAYLIHNKKATTLFHTGRVGKDQNDLETIECFQLLSYGKNYEGYIEEFNRIFFLKTDVFKAEKEDTWLTFIDNGASIKNERISTNNNAHFLARNVIYALCSYTKDIYDIRHHIGTNHAYSQDDWLQEIEEKSKNLPVIANNFLKVDYLKCYQGDDFSVIGNFEEAKKYVASHPPKNRVEVNMLIIKLKHEYNLIYKEIAQLVYTDWENADAETLNRRIGRALQGYSKYFPE